MLKKLLFIIIILSCARCSFAGMKTDRMGVGSVSNPVDLQVSGRVTMSSFTMTTGGTNNYVLTSDAGGIGTWQQSGTGLLNSTNTWTAPQTWISSSTMGTLAVSTITTNGATPIIINNGSQNVVTSGTGNVGIGVLAPTQALVVAGGIVSGQSNVALTGTATTIDVSTCNSVSVTLTANTNINGFTGGTVGQTICIMNTTTNHNLVLVNKNAGAGSNGIVTGTAANVTITNEGGAVLTYNGSFWYCTGTQP